MACVQERRKYGKIGWNVAYDFNDADLSITLSLVRMYLQKSIPNTESENDERPGEGRKQLSPQNATDIPWETLRYLIGEALYGGRVTDDYDRRVLSTYLEEYLGDFIFDNNQPFFFSKTPYGYSLPPICTLSAHVEFIKVHPMLAFRYA